MATKKTGTATTVTLRPSTTDEEIATYRAVLVGDRDSAVKASDRRDAIAAGDVTDDDLRPFAEQFVRQGALERAVKSAGQQVEAANRAVTTAQRDYQAVLRLRDGDAIRHAELAAQDIAQRFAKSLDNIGDITVQAIDATVPDHAGRRRGSVLLTVENSPLSGRLLRGALEGLLGEIAEATTRTPGGHATPYGSVLKDKDADAYVWTYGSVDPEISAERATERVREREADAAHRLMRQHGYEHTSVGEGSRVVVPGEAHI